MAKSYPLHFSAQLRQHLRALRQKHGLTQAQLGARIGVSQARVAEIEANPGLVSLDQILHLLAALDVSLNMVESADDASAISPSATSLSATNLAVQKQMPTIQANRKQTKAQLTSRAHVGESPIISLHLEQDAVDSYFKQLTNAKRGSW